MSATATKEPPVRQYKLVTGQHHERNPGYKGTNAHHPDCHLHFSAGDVITVKDGRELDLLYVNKFELLVPGVNAPVKVTEARKLEVSNLIQRRIILEQDKTFLEELSEDGFERVKRLAAAKGGATEETAKKTTSALGEDVTSQFQQAYDNGFKVFRNATGKHQLTRGPGSKTLNKEPLEEVEVEPFVARYLKEK